jgi:50S ribosomal protein L16 3-hydroxylase
MLAPAGGQVGAATTPSFSLDKSFWRSFAKTYWGRKPTVIRAPFSMPIVSPDEVFRGLLAVRRRLNEPRDDFDLHIAGRRVVLDLERWLPRTSDGSLAAYQARLKRDGQSGQLALLVNEFQSELSWTFYNRLRQFLHGLYEFVGVPGRAELDLFTGNYRRTPLGVHRDEAEVFVFVVEGRKQFRLWPKEAFRSRSPKYGPGPYAKYANGSILLGGDPGDILFWPSGYWHVAESDGQLVSALSLGLYYGYAVSVALMRNIAGWNREIAGDDRDPIASLPFVNSRVPPELAAIAARAEGRPGRLTQRLMRCWMERITGHGFERVPRPSGDAMRAMNGTVRANPISPILHWKSNGDLVIAASGKSIAVPYQSEVVRFLDRVCGGSVCVLPELRRTGERKSPSARDVFRRSIKFLLEQRALESVLPSSRRYR